MRSSLIRLGAMGVLAAITGCTTLADVGLKSDEQPLEDADRFVTITRDLRRCATPLCGGYYVHALNTDAPREYASKLVFEESNLDEATIAKVTGARPSEVVLRGRLGAPEDTHNTRPFIVLEAYRGLPGKEPRTTDAFYQISKRVPPIACVTTPCPNQIAVKLNATERTEIDDVAPDDLREPLLDEGWLRDEIRRRHTIVAGPLDAPTSRPGTQRMLHAHQVYLRLPSRMGPCEVEQRRGCGEQTATYRRDPNRCIVFDRCVDKGVCQDAVPTCPDGYTRRSWIAAPGACPAYACDPSFAE